MAKLIVHTPEMVADYIAKGYLDRLTLADAWDQNARKFHDKEALVDPFLEKRFTWGQLKAISDRKLPSPPWRMQPLVTSLPP